MNFYAVVRFLQFDSLQCSSHNIDFKNPADCTISHIILEKKINHKFFFWYRLANLFDSYINQINSCRRFVFCFPELFNFNPIYGILNSAFDNAWVNGHDIITMISSTYQSYKSNCNGWILVFSNKVKCGTIFYKGSYLSKKSMKCIDNDRNEIRKLKN